MKIAIIGTRADVGALNLEKLVDYIPKNCSLVISGGAFGVDTLAASAAKSLDIPLKIFLPEYNLYGKRAPLVRNEQIALSCDLLLAFWDFSSKGTAATIVHCIEHGVPFNIIDIVHIQI